MNQKALVFGPEHQLCSDAVAIPTIRRNPGDGSFCVQWCGRAQGELPDNVEIPSGAQFLFPLLAVSSSDPRFSLQTDSFAVPFLASAKEWPADSSRQFVIDGPGEGEPNTCLLWALNPSILMADDMIHQVFAAVALLGDPNCGVIAPEPFVDLTVRDRALQRFYSGFDLDPPEQFT